MPLIARRLMPSLRTANSVPPKTRPSASGSRADGAGQLWTVINAVREQLHKPTRKIEDDEELRYFLVGYAAVCL